MNEKAYNHKRAFELINKRIDGELGPVGQDELDTLLAESELARDLNDEMKSLVGLLDTVPERESPAYLENVILSQIRLPRVNMAPTHPQVFFSRWAPGHWIGTGIAAVAAVLLLVGIFRTDDGFTRPGDLRNMSGTMANHAPPVGAEVVDSIRVNSFGLQGALDLRGKAGQYALEVSIESLGSASLNVDFTAGQLELTNSSNLKNTADEITIGAHSIHVTTSGKQHYTIMLRRMAGAIETEINPLGVSIYAGKRLVKKAELGATN